MTLISFDITLIDLLQQLIPHHRRWGMRLIQIQAFQLSTQQGMHRQSGSLTQRRQGHRLVMQVTRSCGIGGNLAVGVESDLLRPFR